MTRRIAVEEGLENVSDALKRQGFQVTKLTSGQLNNVDAAVITGMSNNFMGNHETRGKCSVIEAAGMTADEVVNVVQSRLGHL